MLKLGTDDIVNKTNDVFMTLKPSILYQSDVETYGIDEHWATVAETSTIRDGWMRGDCEDFAIMARDMLQHEGINSRLVLVTDDFGSSHIVTITEHGWILDNMLHAISTVNDLSYHFIMQSGFVGDLIWHFIK